MRETCASAVAIPEIDPETFRRFSGNTSLLRPGYKMTDLVEDLDEPHGAICLYLGRMA